MERIRITGTVGLVTGLLWLVNWAFEAFVDPPVGGGQWYAGQVVATVALFGTAVLLFGLAALRPAGDGRVARTFLALNWVAWLSLTLGGIGMLIHGDESEGPMTLFFPIGGILGTVSLLVSGILVAVRRGLPGWRRWVLLAFAVMYLLLGFLNGGSDEPTAASQGGELVQYVLLLALAAAVRTAPASPVTASPVRV
ncbi:hypothetical protein ACFO1B_55730 [Dactylosporangium siamense]|uniref:DUF998 domain-containing protein n=1 Tax=Dactylosporangium siamense TaxID=685454 RepID=A0A919PZ30_9ACTN|nr:hypothetical protein [Dactylosporangium siamense]GIG51891.1 hypothetical protein Dsi01nite_099320 [Dactylosporangium siamense]